MLRYQLIKAFCRETGYTERAIESKISEGKWRLGHEYIVSPDGRRQISIEGYHAWVESQSPKVLKSPVRQAMKSPSSIGASVAANESRSSPRPLT